MATFCSNLPAAAEYFLASSTCRLGLFCLLDHSRLCSMVGYFFIIMFYHNVGESLRHLLFFALAISHSGYVFSMRKCSERSKGDISFCQRLEILPATSERHPPSANNDSAAKEFALEEGVILNSYYQIWFATRVRPYFIKEGACFQLATRHSFFQRT